VAPSPCGALRPRTHLGKFHLEPEVLDRIRRQVDGLPILRPFPADGWQFLRWPLAPIRCSLALSGGEHNDAPLRFFLSADVGFTSAAIAEKRVALVIGNSTYARAGKLPNPLHDARAIEAMLRSAGFDLVEVKNDLGALAMRRALRDFSDRVRDADIAVAFYAGHGIEVNGSNYLIPVGAVLERDIDVEDETVSLDRVTQVLERLSACGWSFLMLAVTIPLCAL
jgi:Caspase domain